MPNNNFWYCSIGVFAALTSTMCSNLFIVSMTFQRFYGIVQPHKAASFNTVRKAKIIIACIVIFSFMYRFPIYLQLKFKDSIVSSMEKYWEKPMVNSTTG